nr:HAMP domain-containing methyl-accepting chemotaxis protein [Shinella granuli]
MNDAAQHQADVLAACPAAAALLALRLGQRFSFEAKSSPRRFGKCILYRVSAVFVMKNLTIKTSLIALMSAIIVIIAISSFVALQSIRSITTSAEKVGNFWIERLLATREVKGDFADVRLALARLAMVNDETEFQAEMELLDAAKAKLETSIVKYEAGVFSPTGRALITEIRSLAAHYLNRSVAYTGHVKNHNVDAARTAFTTELKPIANQTNETISKLVAFIMTQTENEVAAADNAANDAFFLSLAIASAAVLISLSGIYVIVARVANPIQRITDAMRRLAGGDVESEVPFTGRRDEIGAMAGAVQVFRENAIERLRLEREAEMNRSLGERERLEREALKAQEAADVKFAVDNLAAGLSKLSNGDVSYRIGNRFTATLDGVRGDFNSSAAKLQSALARVAENARGIDAGANEIKAATDDLAKRSEQQAAAVEETAAALEEITTVVKDSARRAHEAGQLVAGARSHAEQSGVVVRRAVGAMEQIEKSSNEISNIIGVIDEIAFQTNLLALNAGVEAARAGEAGKGFAVVAQEVRELAQRSANAAKEIKALIIASKAQVQEGVQLVGDTGRVLETIVTEVQEINRHVSAIVEAAQEQSSGLQQINTAVNQMDQDTQKNAAMVEETTAATHSLSREVVSLNELLALFKLSETAPQVSASSRRATAPAAQSPVHELGRRLVTAFSGNAAIKQDDWEEF